MFLRSFRIAHHSEVPLITSHKPTFYEQVTGVKVCSLLFPS